ncbi:MAG: rod shape-determining protein MreC [Albidovulum sp.]|nr:rod shape-determining protein MreC [Albidovulum sp.]MDE0530231.1 rod shape-determining protein MreC [Albidovulum sp.]
METRHSIRDPKANARPRPTARGIVLALCVAVLVLLFAAWRFDNPRVESLRTKFIDAILPSFEIGIEPGRLAWKFFGSIENFSRLVERNEELNLELTQMQEWREIAHNLERQNANLRRLLGVSAAAPHYSISASVIADSSSPFRQSFLISAGRENGIVDGWAVTDGLGLVGRISGVGNSTSRVIQITDPNSRIPVRLDSGNRAILLGDNSHSPILDMIERVDDIELNDRVLTSGDGKVFPAETFVGFVVKDAKNRFRVRPSANFRDLQFVRVIRVFPAEPIDGPGELIVESAQPLQPVNSEAAAISGN